MFLVHTYTFKGNYLSQIDTKIAVIIYLGESGLIGERQVNPAIWLSLPTKWFFLKQELN